LPQQQLLIGNFDLLDLIGKATAAPPRLPTTVSAGNNFNLPRRRNAGFLIIKAPLSYTSHFMRHFREHAFLATPINRANAAADAVSKGKAKKVHITNMLR
jgi:hypothetical protein